MVVIKGMVQVFGTTYRIVRYEAGHYQAVRIHDEAVVGSFSCAKALIVTPFAVELALMRAIAAAAVHEGKTSWMGPAIRIPS
jgi:hypothetical protein